MRIRKETKIMMNLIEKKEFSTKMTNRKCVKLAIKSGEVWSAVCVKIIL